MDQVTPCPACGKWVQTSAVECRHCGKALPQAPDLGALSTPASRAAAANPVPAARLGATHENTSTWAVFFLTILAAIVLGIWIARGTAPYPVIVGFWMAGWLNTVCLLWLLIRSAVRDAIVSARAEGGE